MGKKKHRETNDEIRKRFEKEAHDRENKELSEFKERYFTAIKTKSRIKKFKLTKKV
jgi:hypothetical protein